jgi:hypothetical protein
MKEVFEALLTALANIGGYALAALVVVHYLRRHGSFVAGFPAAATALFVLWALIVFWYIGTEYWLDQYPQTIERGARAFSQPPTWLDASNGIAENQQSEVFQVWLAALVFKYLKWPGTPESQ